MRQLSQWQRLGRGSQLVALLALGCMCLSIMGSWTLNSTGVLPLGSGTWANAATCRWQ